MKRKLAMIFAVAAAMAFTPATSDERFTAVLDGEHTAPPVITSAGAIANFRILGDTAIQYELKVARLRDVWTAGIYSSGGDSSGFKAVTLFVGAKPGEVNGTLAEGTVTDRDMLSAMTVKELAELMRSRRAYVEIHTAAHPSGELRGQVVPAAEWERKVAIETTTPLIY